METKLRSASIVLRDGRLLVQQMRGDDCWALPGGTVEPGESPREALLRELREELGAPPEISIGHFSGCVNNAFTRDGRQIHEIGFYFATTIRNLPVDGPFEGAEIDKSIQFDWLRESEWSLLKPSGIVPIILGETRYVELELDT